MKVNWLVALFVLVLGLVVLLNRESAKAQTAGLPSFVTVGACVKVWSVAGEGRAVWVKVDAIEGHWIKAGQGEKGRDSSWAFPGHWFNLDVAPTLLAVDCPK